MANGLVSLPANTWVKIADSGYPFDWVRYSGAANMGEINIDATTMFSGVTGAAYIWAYSPSIGGEIWRSHA